MGPHLVRCAFGAVLTVFSLLALAVPGGAVGSVRVTPQDRAATHALLEARYVYEQALLAAAPASMVAERGLAGALGGECPGVLAGAPQETPRTLFGSPLRSSSPRQIGEANRESRQLGDLQSELSLALDGPLIDSDRQAALSYARAVKSLHWTSSTLTALEHTGAAELEWELRSAPPQVCADMKAWVSSGYKTLSPATKTLIGERETVVTQYFHALRELLASFHGSDPLAVDPLQLYEGPHEKTLVQKTDVLAADLKRARKGSGNVEMGLERTLGLTAQAETQPEAEEAHEGPAKGSVEIGHGRTAAGGDYTVWLEPKPGSSPSAPRCPLSMEVFETEDTHGSEGSEIDGTGVNEVCLSRSHPGAPSVQCHGNVLTIEAQTLPRTRTVRLRLIDGRQITTRVALVPAKLGGPAGFYYQAVRGSSPIPVALTEVDTHGKVLRTVRLPRTPKCFEQPPKLLPGGHRTIARGTLPQGPGFSIVGERYSLAGKIHFDVSVEVAANAEARGLIGGESTIAVGVEPKPMPRKASPPFALQLKTGCQPHEYAILYGILKDPTDTVLARSSGSLRPLRRVRIPASLHVHGVLAYIALTAVPDELLLRTHAGKTVFTEKLASRARTTRETCEGEAEGPG